MRLSVVFLAALILLAACDLAPATPIAVPTSTPTPQPAVIASPTPVNTILQEGRYTVNLVYRQQAAYGRGAGGLDEESRWSPFFRAVTQHLSDFFAGYADPDAQLARWTSQGAEVEPSEYVELAELADSAGLPAIITGTLAAVEGELPAEPATIYVFSGIATLADGVGSAGPGPGRVALVFGDDTLLEGDDPAASWSRWVPYHLRRELYLGARLAALGRTAKGEETLLDILIDYGLADTFAARAQPDLTPPWLDALDPDQEKAVWAEMQADLSSSDPDTINVYIAGSSAGVTPTWSAFHIGHRIIATYLQRHPEATTITLLGTPAAQILAASGYE